MWYDFMKGSQASPFSPSDVDEGESGEDVKEYWRRKIEVLCCLVHGLTCDRTRASAVRGLENNYSIKMLCLRGLGLYLFV
jgi:hypothetical protein